MTPARIGRIPIITFLNNPPQLIIIIFMFNRRIGAVGAPIVQFGHQIPILIPYDKFLERIGVVQGRQQTTGGIIVPGEGNFFGARQRSMEAPFIVISQRDILNRNSMIRQDMSGRTAQVITLPDENGIIKPRRIFALLFTIPVVGKNTCPQGIRYIGHLS